MATGPSRSSRAISEACKVAGTDSAASDVVASTAATRSLLPGAFQHRLGQFLDEQRHAVGALDDLRDDLGGERRIAGQPLHQRRAVASAEPIERQHS